MLSKTNQIRAIIKAYGEVQRVGYRFIVQETARKMGIKGQVKNLPDSSVEIIAEGPKEVLERFVKAITLKEPPINVEELDVAYKDATGEYQYFGLVSGELAEEMIEGFGTGLKYINISRDESRKGFQSLENTIKATHEDLKGTISDMHKDLKQETAGTKEAIKDMHKDLKQETTGIKSAIGEMHKDLKEETAGIRAGISEMRQDLKGEIGIVGTEVREMHVDMSRSFDEMANRYDAISSELVRTREELTRAVDGLLKLIDEFIHQRDRTAGLDRREQP